AELAQRLSPEELYDFLFLPGFSTRDQVSDISGRGVGLDVVQTMVHACGGALRVSSAAGKGTRFQLQLPVTRSVLRVLLARIAGEVFALPLARIERAGRLACSELRSMEGHHYCRWDGDNVAVVSAAALLGRESAVPVAEELTLVFIAGGWQRYAWRWTACWASASWWCALGRPPGQSAKPRRHGLERAGRAAVDPGRGRFAAFGGGA
ncbi:ATP-binding protein, partial [Methylogaea oryzae]|uniref:ATP-binding protein n=1 Tax=Methylogaea oryzae TaxID=1295382 RepID=UPI000B15DE79